MTEGVQSNSKPTPNYYDARRRIERTLSVGEQSVTLKTFSFFAQAQFEHYRRQYVKGLDSTSATAFDKLNNLIKLLDSAYSDWRSLDVSGLPDLIIAISDLNPNPPDMAWQTISEDVAELEKEETKPPEGGLSYTGSNIVGIAAYLSDTFGISPTEVLDNMTLYEVNCLLQEAYLLEYKHQEWDYTLAGDVGYEKVGEEWKKTPLPAPEWMNKSKKVDEGKAALLKFNRDKKKIKEEVAARGMNKVLDRASPTGKIFDFTKMGPGGMPAITFNDLPDEERPAVSSASISTILPSSDKVTE